MSPSSSASRSNQSATPAHSQSAEILNPESSNSPSSELEPFEYEDTTSLTESITNYPIINGRRYHRFREGSYIFPNDEPENERLDLQHKLITIMHGGRIFFAPIRDPKRILDIGTGTGLWPIEMATYFPRATIIGTDLSPIQPNEVPENVHFVIDDAAESDWAYESQEHFDYIHSRCMFGALPSYENLIRNSFKYLKPGTGYLECQEWSLDLHCDDNTLANATDYPFRDWIDYAHRASEEAIDPPKPIRIAQNIKRWMEEAGFVDVHEQITKVPVNPWSRDPHMKTMGRWHLANWLDGLSAFSYGLFGSRGLGWTQSEIEVFLVGVRKSLQNRRVHAYEHFYVVTGRKPAEIEANDQQMGEDVNDSDEGDEG